MCCRSGRLHRALPWPLGLLVLVCRLAGAAPTPNVVLVVIDDLGYGEMSCQSPGTDVPTPHLDAIAAEGVRFTDGYVTAPFCAASRAGLFTGRYQTRFGFEFNPIGARNDEPGIGLPTGVSTLADLLREGTGHATGLVGKWHLGGTAPFHPMRRGFDEFFGFLHEDHFFVPPPYRDVTTWVRRKTLPGGGEGRWTSRDGRTILSTRMGHREPDYDANNPVTRGSQPVEERANLTEAFTREAVDFIRRHAERPFFLCVAYNAVHSPLQADDRYLARFGHLEDIQRRIFAAMLAQLDEGVGRITGTLDELGLEQNTLLVVLSDNGGPTRELTSRNGPLRGEKGSLLEGGIRVPFLMRWPERIPAGHVFTEPVLSLDIMATAAAGCGIPLQPGQCDGVDLVPHLAGAAGSVPHGELFWRVGSQAAFRSGPWKLYRPASRGGTATSWQLYRLDRDIGEGANLAEAEPERLRELVERWEAWNAGMVEPLWR